MATIIRLTRMGRKKRPFYRVVVADSRMPRDGRFIEILGVYDPLAETPVIKIDENKALNWLSKGAQVSDTVKQLFKKSGVMKRFNEIRETSSS
ncbi:MAG: 30S ribosomal protein S16 [Nitrospirae bacterium RIFCSPLOW2_12_42_9]|nr:MAG: 30S ribosomal protein S16 [Nitrospirae bacterium RIFCSPLOW2_12_42_9]OGW59917.1 MAG: 30S ribosomal protein S16 [Nitrospirae bacterium RIFCSPHIGHO2_02_FULL_42_12]HBI22817.1 30S ribosomal protein S16 [Nitrospiraceae bacterium]